MSSKPEEQAKAMTPKVLTSKAITVLFDGSCPLCAAEIATYKRADSNDSLTLVDVSDQSFTGQGSISRSDAMARFHVRLPDGRHASGAQGFVEVWRVLPSWRWLAAIDRIPGGVAVLEMVYRGFLRIRPLSVRAFFLYQRAFGRAPEVPPEQVPPSTNSNKARSQ
jgi:predicted DCC family thiol-disulfide oxidoreductase YuxK